MSDEAEMVSVFRSWKNNTLASRSLMIVVAELILLCNLSCDNKAPIGLPIDSNDCGKPKSTLIATDVLWDKLRPENIEYIIFGRIDENPESEQKKWDPEKDSWGVFVELFRITNRDEIVSLANNLNSIKNRNDGEFVFSGVLSSQVYVDINGDIVALVTVMNENNTIGIDTSAIWQNNKVHLIDPSGKIVASAVEEMYFNLTEKMLKSYGVFRDSDGRMKRRVKSSGP